MHSLRAGAIYSTLVFAAGFGLGIIRTLWIVPRTGARAAELMEAPVMLLVSLVAARWVVRWLALPNHLRNRLSMGAIALGLMLLAEFTLMLRLRGLSISQYLAARDPVAATLIVLSSWPSPSYRF